MSYLIKRIISNKYCHTDNHYSVHLPYIYAKLYVVTETYMQNIPQYIGFCKYQALEMNVTRFEGFILNFLDSANEQ